MADAYPYRVAFAWKARGNVHPTLTLLAQSFPLQPRLYLAGHDAIVAPEPGPVRFERAEDGVAHDAWCERRDEEQLVLRFASAEAHRALIDRINADLLARAVVVEKAASRRLMRFDERSESWQHQGQYEPRLRVNFMGYDDVLEELLRDCADLARHCAALRVIGEHRSVNVLLHGPPGSGKTTLAMLLATLLHACLFVVNPATLKGEHLHVALNPTTVVAERHKIMLFEDFDRYLAPEAHKHVAAPIAQLLNALDGADSRAGVVRIFTANDVAAVRACPALLSRMGAVYEFAPPAAAALAQKLRLLLSSVPGRAPEADEDARVARLAERAAELGVSLRAFTSHCIRPLFGPGALGVMEAGFDRLRDTLPTAFAPPVSPRQAKANRQAERRAAFVAQQAAALRAAAEPVPPAAEPVPPPGAA
jgi:energy-coupling factor transporter ATP-binding protein EcfA2